jgi:pimeloyl-ACP methyl ester carboxylesterase
MTSKSFFRGFFWSLVALLLLAHVVGGWYFSSVMIEDGFTPSGNPIVAPAGNVVTEDASYRSPLGEMDAFYLPADGSDTWVIHVHGKGVGPEEADFLFEPIQEAGYPQLWITYRNDEGQPADPSGFYQYGATEWEDIRAALEYAEDQGAGNVVFSGLSTGSSHILSFLYRNRLDIVSGVIMDSPNVDFGDTVDFNAAQRDLPLVPFDVPPTVTWVAKFVTSLRIGVNWKSIDYIADAGTNLRTPVLIHHGTDDESVPVEQSIEFAEEAPELVELVQVVGAGHMESVEVDPTKYIDEILAFLAEVS